jgi:predicted component of type VI protein secretion system
VGPTFDFDVQPTLRPEEVPPCRLSPTLDEGPYLGWNTWIPRQEVGRGPVSDAVFQIETL